MLRRSPAATVLCFCALAIANAGANTANARAQLPRAQSAPPPSQTRLPQAQSQSVVPLTPQTGAPQTIVLPKVLVAGERATLAVIDAAGRLVPAVDITLSSGAKIATDDTGRASFQAPPKPGLLTARIVETAQDFTTAVVAGPTNAGAKASASAKASAAPPTVAASPRFVAPPVIALQEPFDILGSGFSGDAYLDTVAVGNLPALVLAASPVSLVAQTSPRTGAGPGELTVGLAGGQVNVQSVTVVSVEVLGPEQPLSPGETSALTVRVNGSSERLTLEARSLTPSVVALLRSDTEDWSTSGGRANETRIKVRVVNAGPYFLSVRLAAVGAANIEAARLQLLAARQLSNAQWQEALDRTIQPMEHATTHRGEADAQHAARFRQQIEVLLRNQPQEPIASLLRLAWQSLGLTSD